MNFTWARPMLSFSFLVILFRASMGEQTANAQSLSDRKVILDRVELIGDTSETGDTLTESLGLSVGKLISAEQAADEVVEAERRLRAAGKYKDDFQVQTIRGSSYPHQILRIQVMPKDPWYFGVTGEVQRDDTPGNSGSYTVTTHQDRYKMSGYFGSRDWLESGLSLDIEFLSFNGKFKDFGDSSVGNYNSKYDFYLNGIAATLLNKSIYGTSFYFGVQPGISRYDNYINYDSQYSYVSSGKKYRSVYEGSETMRTFSAGGEGIIGYRRSKLSLSASASRFFARKYSHQTNFRTSQFVDDSPVESGNGIVSSFDGEGGGYYVNREVGFRIGWSDKTGLGLIEPGLVASASWKRSGSDLKIDKPEIKTMAAYTWVVDRSGLTLSGAEKWEFRGESDYQTAVGRTIQIGVRGDYIGPGDAVYFCEVFRFGGKRSELEYSGQKREGNTFKTRANVGVRYASNSMLYSVSLGYGPDTLDSENLASKQNGTAYDRIGVQ